MPARPYSVGAVFAVFLAARLRGADARAFVRGAGSWGAGALSVGAADALGAAGAAGAANTVLSIGHGVSLNVTSGLRGARLFAGLRFAVSLSWAGAAAVSVSGSVTTTTSGAGTKSGTFA